MNDNNRIRFLFFFSIWALFVNASRPDSINVSGFVRDSFTSEALANVSVSIMNADSTLVSKFITQDRDPEGRYSKGTINMYVPKSGTYLVQMESDGYETTFQKINIPDKKYQRWIRKWEVELFIRKQNRIHTVELGSAVVKATKIKMITRGDTLIYNADAFQMSEGSMLNNLIASMPGFKIEKDGNITHNGEHVENILINGRNFFKGNPRIALENLPSYTVNNIKVYRKVSDYAYMIQDRSRNILEKSLVADVILKKQYHEGWLANAEAGVGTSERYLARLFAMRFTDRTRLALFGNTNNINENGKTDSYGEWAEKEDLTGRMRLTEGGASFYWDARKSHASLTSDLTASRKSLDDEQYISSTNYQASSNEYVRTHSVLNNKETHINLFNEIYYPGKKIYISAYPTFDYRYSTSDGINRSLRFDANPQDTYRGACLDSIFSKAGSKRLTDMLVNQLEENTAGEYRHLNVGGNIRMMLHSPIFGNNISILARGKYKKEKGKEYSQYSLEQPNNGSNEFRNRYSRQPSSSYDYLTELEYSFGIGKILNLSLKYSYWQQYKDDDRSLYCLESLDGWNTPSERTFSNLPSYDILQTSIDVNNSYCRNEWQKDHVMGMSLRWSLGKRKDLSLALPVAINHHTIEDIRNGIYQHKTDNMEAFNPNVKFRMSRSDDKGFSSFDAGYELLHQQPDMIHLLDVTDDSHPLFVWKGTDELHNRIDHLLNMQYKKNRKLHQKSMTIIGKYNVISNAVAQTVTYDRQSGVSTFKPSNINGNWIANAEFLYGQCIDSLDRWRIENKSAVRYGNSSDYLSEKGSIPFRNSVRNFHIMEGVELGYSLKDFNISIKADVSWNCLYGNRQIFTDVKSWDIAYGIRSRFKFVWDIDFNTDLMMFTRCGYNDKSLNESNLLWNVHFSRSILNNKKLILKLDGIDILHNLSNVRVVMNEQGRTETWYNTLPNYMIVRLVYLFSKKPSK